MYDWVSVMQDREKSLDTESIGFSGTNKHVLLEMGERLANAVDVDLFFDTVSRALRHFLHIDRASLALYNRDQNLFELVALAVQGESRLGIGTKVPHQGSRTGMVFDSRMPMLHTLDSNTAFFEDQPLLDEGLRFAAQMPILVDGVCIGTLNTDFKRYSNLSEAEMDLLCGIARQIATSVTASNKRPRTAASEGNVLNAPERGSAETQDGYLPLIRPSMQSSVDRLVVIAKTDSTVLLVGETGTGKGVLARKIHDWSNRKKKPFVKCDCAAINSQLIESELFGHEKGAFTGANARRLGCFEQANGGTLFLDEITELPLDNQVKLLGVLQDRSVQRVGGGVPVPIDVRIIAATNRNIEAEVAAGRFRSDLYYRLNVFQVALPPLRQTLQDLEPLAKYFLEMHGRAMQRNLPCLDAASLRAMHEHSWPGNIRELENFIQRALLLESCGTFEARTLLFDRPTSAPQEISSDGSIRTLEQVEADHIRRVLNATGWRINGRKGAADLLGLHPSTVRSRMARLNVQRPGPHA